MRALGNAVLALVTVPAIVSSPARADGPKGPGAGLVPFVEEGTLVGGVTSYGLVLYDGEVPRAVDLAPLGSAPPLWFHKARGGRLLAGTVSGVFQTEDQGCSWSRIGGLLEGRERTTLARDPDDADHVFIGTGAQHGDNVIVESRDGGRTFTPVAWETSERVLALAVAPGGARLWVLSPSGVRLRSDDGRGWQLGPGSLADYHDLRLLGVSADGATLYLAGAGAAGDVLLEWPDGLALVRRATLAPSSFVFSSRRIAALAQAGDRLFALTSPDGLSRVGDQGAFEPLAPRALCLLAANGELWRCGTKGDGALFSRSRDGLTWEPVLLAPVHHFEARSCTPAEAPPEVPPFAESGGNPQVAGGCRAAPSRAPAGASAALALLALLALRRRFSR